MPTQLSSLRVDATFDASAYARGAAQKSAADQHMITTDRALLASQAAVAASMVSVGNKIGNYTDAINDNSAAIAQASASNNDAGKSFAISTIDAANYANKLKTLTIAAYALSPAFRSFVNPAITQSVRALGPAAMSAGGAMLSAFSPVLATIGRLALPIGIAVEGFRAMNAITELGANKIKEFNELAAKSAGAGVGTDFFQHQAAGAKEFGIEATLATDALKKFHEIDAIQLGGSPLNQRLDQLTAAGNFVGNSGVAALRQATDAESRYRAVVELITVATDQGQRLAALDLAAKFLPPELLERLRVSGDTLKQLQVTADEIKPADIVSAEQIGYALELKRRMEDAKEVIANGLKPLQRDLTQLGLEYQIFWIRVTEAMAKGVTIGNDLYGALKGIPDLFAQAGNSPFWAKLTTYTERLGLNSYPASLGIVMKGQPGYEDDPARRALGAQLQNPSAVQRAMLQATTVQSAVRGDTSINPVTATGRQDANDAVDRAINSLRKHTEEQLADAKAAGLGAAALARFRAEAAETSAIQANGGKITAEQAAQFEVLKSRAADAALSLEKAKIAANINFGRATALLSPDDVAIAQQLKGLYPDVSTALDSVQASSIRTNSALSGLSSSISGNLVTGLTDIADSTKPIGQGFTDMSKTVIRALSEMAIKIAVVTPLMRAMQAAAGAFGFGSLGGGAFGAQQAPLSAFPIPNANGNAYGSNIIPFARGGAFSNQIVASPTLFRFAGGTGMMGEAGPEAVMPLRRGPGGRLGVEIHGGNDNRPSGGIVVNLLNAPAGTTATATSSKGPNGGMQLDVVFANSVRGVIRGDMASGQGIAPDLQQFARTSGFRGS